MNRKSLALKCLDLAQSWGSRSPDATQCALELLGTVEDHVDEEMEAFLAGGERGDLVREFFRKAYEKEKD